MILKLYNDWLSKSEEKVSVKNYLTYKYIKKNKKCLKKKEQ
jgi:hypothetical protein